MCIGHQSMAVARECCNGDCNQGRACPVPHSPSRAAWQLAAGLVVSLAVVLVLGSGVLA